MVVPTRVRSARATALFAAFQAAFGTPVSDFTTAAAARLWTELARPWIGPQVYLEAFMDADGGPSDAALDVDPDKPEGTLLVKGTPTALEWLLRSNYGAFAAGAFSLATGISSSRWLTLGWVEDRFNGTSSLERLVRIRDAWVHRLALAWAGAGDGKQLLLEASWAGRKALSQLLNAGGITLPATPMSAPDKDPFPAANTTLVRDPAGANVSLRWRDLRVTFNQGLGRDWDMGAGLWDVYKAGPLEAQLAFTSDWSDETWDLVDLARAKTKSTFRITSTCEDGTVLTITLYGVILQVEEQPGHDGQEHAAFSARGVASRVGSDLVTITMA